MLAREKGAVVVECASKDRLQVAVAAALEAEAQ